VKINRLVLQNFKKFSDQVIEFGDGFNVVVGENESGKSSIVEALFLVLYASPASKSKDLVKFYSWKNDKPFRLELEFEALGKKHFLIKDFLKKEGTLKLPSGKEITNPDLIQEYLYTELNIPLKSIYLNSAFIKQDEIMKLDFDGEFKNSIQNMVVEGEDEIDISNIEKVLDKRITLLSKGIKGNAINPGPIKALSQTIEREESEIRIIEDRWNLSLGSQGIVESNNLEITKLTEDLNIKIAFLKKVSILKDFSKRAIELNKKYDEFVGIEDEYKENEKIINSKKKEIDGNYEVYKNVENISKIEEEISTLIAQENILSKVETQAPEKPQNSHKINAALIVGAFAVGLLMSVILKDFIPIISAIVAIGVYVLSIKLQQKGRKIIPNGPKNEDGLLSETKEQIELLCKQFGTDDIQKVLKAVVEYRALLSKITDLELKRKYILGKYTVEEIEINKKVTLKELSKVEIQLEDSKVGDSSYTEEKLHQLEYDIERVQDKLQQLKNETLILEARLASSDISLEGINIKKEQLEESKNELLGYKDELDVFLLVKESISKSYEETVKDSRVVIEELVNRNIANLTNGRYTNIKLSPELDLEVFSKEKGEYISLENLSKGTIDQIFLLVRLGFAEGLLGANKMPVILDDPFVNFDEKRVLNIKNILVKLSSDYQLILFTHNEYYSDWGYISRLG